MQFYHRKKKMKFDGEQAINEGWCLSQCTGSSYFPEDWINIERWDESTHFPSDLDAAAFVFSRAAAGSEYHKEAIRVMETTNFDRVREAEA